MATERKVPDLPALTTPASGDLASIVDISDTSEDPGGTSKKITWTNFLSAAAGVLFQAYSAVLDTWATKTPPTGTVVGTSDSQTLTGKTINGDNNTITNIATAAIKDANVTSRKMKADKKQVVTSVTDLNTSSGSYIDYTGLSISITPDVASDLLVLFTCNHTNGAQGLNSFIVDIDGSTSGNDPLCSAQSDNGGFGLHASGFLWITGVSAAAHTIKIKAKTSANTMHTQYGSLTVIPFAA